MLHGSGIGMFFRTRSIHRKSNHLTDRWQHYCLTLDGRENTLSEIDNNFASHFSCILNMLGTRKPFVYRRQLRSQLVQNEGFDLRLNIFRSSFWTFQGKSRPDSFRLHVGGRECLVTPPQFHTVSVKEPKKSKPRQSIMYSYIFWSPSVVVPTKTTCFARRKQQNSVERPGLQFQLYTSK